VTQRGLTLLAVDDEPVPLEDLARLLRSAPIVREVRCATSGQQALGMIAAEHYDGIFLDLRMPDLDGMQLGRLLRHRAAPPQLVFVSAHENGAVDAFELHALDYLLKPVGRRRLEETLLRLAAAVWPGGGAEAAEPVGPGAAGDRLSQPGAGAEDDTVAVSNPRGGGIRLLARSSILYVQSHGDYVRVVNEDGRYLLRATLSEIERRWEPFGFVRVHRQYVANLRLAQEVRPQIGGTAVLTFPGVEPIPVARRQASALARRLQL
jgi:DNA-binding LytR/AlgR family response regulator